MPDFNEPINVTALTVFLKGKAMNADKSKLLLLKGSEAARSAKIGDVAEDPDVAVKSK
ncbi:MAG: hypothetical protein ABJO67_19750 [Pseudoruegeria sp.]